jgi:thiosulfate reductase cytochrome b subunit
VLIKVNQGNKIMEQNNTKHKRKVKIYTLYERFWHWSQALLIFILAFSGFGVHGTHNLLDFDLAVKMHTIVAIALIILWIFTTFWNFTTGNWRQFMPTSKGLFPVIRYYAWGILFGEEHPHKKTLRRKQNALQGLAYLTFMVLIGPLLWSTGIIYLVYDFWNEIANASFYFNIIVIIHTFAAFMMVSFGIVHIYMTTTGKTPLHYIKTMFTGMETVELTKVEEDYLKTEYPERLDNNK